MAEPFTAGFFPSQMFNAAGPSGGAGGWQFPGLMLGLREGKRQR